MSVIRKLRGVLGTAMTWATTWGVIGAGLHGLFALIGWNGFLVPGLLPEVLVHAMMGFAGGAAFSAGLVLTESHRGLEGLSLGRSGAWGALAGLAGPLLVFFFGSDFTWPMFTTTWPLFLGTAILGVGSGVGMAAIAQRAERDAVAESSTPPDGHLHRGGVPQPLYPGGAS